MGWMRKDKEGKIREMGGREGKMGKGGKEKGGKDRGRGYEDEKGKGMRGTKMEEKGEWKKCEAAKTAKTAIFPNFYLWGFCTHPIPILAKCGK